MPLGMLAPIRIRGKHGFSKKTLRTGLTRDLGAVECGLR